jgi:hypothetical protein
VKPPARGAAVRGDDYQYAVAWVEACRALNDAGIASVSVEDAGAGQFDDVAVRRTDAHPDRYFQVKSSNAGDVAIDERWLTTAATEKGQSPLQHFHRTWKELTERGRPFELTLLTNRAFDNGHALIGPARNNFDCHIRVDEVRQATSRSDLGKARDAWATHLDIDVDELLEFLTVMRWEQAGAEESVREIAKPLMKLAGLRDDDEAVEIGIAIIRGLVKTGGGPQPPDQLRQAIDENNLLASSAQVILAVHAIDRPTSPNTTHVTIDWLDQFPGEDDRSRYRAADPAAWTSTFPADLKRARTSLEMYRTRRVLVTGALRLSTHFAVGYELADIRRWVLAVDQRGEIWTTDADPAPGITAAILAEEPIDQGEGLAVVIALSNDPTEDVHLYVKEQQLPVKTLLTLGPDTGPGGKAVPSNAWLTAWARSARDAVRRAARRADHVHLFMNAPASAALMLGHQWNTVPVPTTVYDFDRRDYFPTFRFS